MRMEAHIPYVSPDDAFAVLADIKIRKQWDNRLEEYTIIEKSDICVKQYNKLMRVRIPFFAQRDQLVKQFLKKDYPVAGKHISISKSFEHPDFPEGYEGCCRTHATMVGYEFGWDEQGTGTSIRYIYINDLKGSLPGLLVQMMANKMMKKGFADMENAMKMY